VKPVLTLGFASLLIGLAGCGAGSSASSRASVQRDLENIPALQAQNLTVRVAEFKDGFLTLEVSGFPLPPRPAFRQEVIEEYQKGMSWRDMRMWVWDPPQVYALVIAEEVLARRPDVRHVRWIWLEAEGR
jgi:hypothetical protein